MNARWTRRPAGGARKGFTLLELIVVITIIGILGTMVVVKVQGWVWEAKKTKIKHDLQSIVEAAGQYTLQFGIPPSSLEDLKTGAKGASGDEVNSTIDANSLKDPWGNEYGFEMLQDGKPRAHCLGRDNSEGGEGENQDWYYPSEGTR